MIQKINPGFLPNPAIAIGSTLGALCFLASASQSFAHQNKVAISFKGDQRCLVSNGLPDHTTGKFPNRGNPNTISAQNISLCVKTNPRKNSRAQPIRGSIGVAINGVQFRPGTADFYDASSPRGFSRDRSSGWNLEGLGAREKLGMDKNNAHVDERGLYHYHGVAAALARASHGSLIGYAADGFEIHYVGNKQTASYKLKPGKRSTPPNGKHDGTYNEDWQYVAKSGTLDRCNGGSLNGKFVYFATSTYPFFPRCLWGTPSADFAHARPQKHARNGEKRPPRRLGNDGQRARAGQRHKRPQSVNNQQGVRHQRGGRPPQFAIAACSAKKANSTCSVQTPNGRNLRGRCRNTPADVIACVPSRGG